jgi:hypothetical protein
MMIDVDSNSKTGGINGEDYMVQISYNKEKGWTKKFIENSVFDDAFSQLHRYHPVSNNSIISEEEIENITNKKIVNFGIDLKELNYPNIFDISFYATIDPGEGRYYEDYTGWARIPPPSMDISFSENPVIIRQGGEPKIIQITINSTTGLEPIIDLSTENKTSKIELKFLEKNKSNIKIPSYGIITIPLKITPKNATAGDQFVFPLFAKSTFPFKSFRVESDGSNIPSPFVDNIQQSTLIIDIIKPFEPYEYLTQFIENYFKPLTGIYQTASSIIGGITGYLIGKKNRKGQTKDKFKKSKNLNQ